MSPPRHLLMSWDELAGLCRDLAVRVARSYQPEVVVGIARTGTLPAALIGLILRAEFQSLRVPSGDGAVEVCPSLPARERASWDVTCLWLTRWPTPGRSYAGPNEPCGGSAPQTCAHSCSLGLGTARMQISRVRRFPLSPYSPGSGRSPWQTGNSSRHRAPRCASCPADAGLDLSPSYRGLLLSERTSKAFPSVLSLIRFTHRTHPQAEGRIGRRPDEAQSGRGVR